MIKKLLLIVAIVFIGLSACSQNKGKTRTKATKAKTEKTTTAATDTATGKVIFLTTAEFKKKVIDFEKHPNEWVFEGKKPAIIDFFATWCGPCRRMSPTVDKIAKDYAGKIDVYKIDIDKEKQLVMTDAGNNILWLIGQRLDNRLRISGNTKKILTIEFICN